MHVSFVASVITRVIKLEVRQNACIQAKDLTIQREDVVRATFNFTI
jgi:hypothetical protein